MTVTPEEIAELREGLIKAVQFRRRHDAEIFVELADGLLPRLLDEREEREAEIIAWGNIHAKDIDIIAQYYQRIAKLEAALAAVRKHVEEDCGECAECFVESGLAPW